MNPRVFKREGLKHLDRVIELCAKYGIYTVIDLHAAPGGQNIDWHADAGNHQAQCEFRFFSLGWLSGRKLLRLKYWMPASSPSVSKCSVTDDVVVVWNHKDFQDRTILIWEELARHYKNNTWVAGYNPLNEPTDEEHIRLLTFYDRVEKAIRAIDPHHILFLE